MKTATENRAFIKIHQEFHCRSNVSYVKYNYFNINSSFIHKINRKAMGTHATVVYANLTCRYLEVKLFNKLPEIFSYDMVEFFLKNSLDF